MPGIVLSPRFDSTWLTLFALFLWFLTSSVDFRLWSFLPFLHLDCATFVKVALGVDKTFPMQQVPRLPLHLF